MDVLEIESRTIAKVSRRIVPFLIGCYFVAYLDRVNVSFAALTMNKDLGLTASQYGFGAGIFFLAYFFFEVPSNLLLERFGARKWIARIMFTWGVISGGMAFISGPTAFYVLRALLGIAEAGFFPGIIFYLTLWFPAVYRARIIGFRAARARRKAASRLIRITSDHSSSFIRIARLSRVTPALLIRMSICPSASTACGTSASTAAPSPRLQTKATWSPPRPARNASSFSALEPDTASRAPCPARPFAMAEPIPPDAPVTKAVIPERSNILSPWSHHSVASRGPCFASPLSP